MRDDLVSLFHRFFVDVENRSESFDRPDIKSVALNDSQFTTQLSKFFHEFQELLFVSCLIKKEPASKKRRVAQSAAVVHCPRRPVPGLLARMCLPHGRM